MESFSGAWERPRPPCKTDVVFFRVLVDRRAFFTSDRVGDCHTILTLSPGIASATVS